MEGMLLFLDNAAQYWAHALFQMTWQSSLVIIAVALIALFCKRLSPAWRMGLWLLVFVKLVLPPALSLPVGIRNFYPDKMTASIEEVRMPIVRSAPAEPPITTEAPSVETPRSEERTPTYWAYPEAAASAAPSRPVEEPASVTRSSRPEVTVSYPLISLFLAWSIAVAAIVLYILIRCRSFIRGVRANASPCQDSVRALAEELTSRIGLKRTPDIIISRRASSPFSFGIIRPKVVIPAEMVEKLDTRHLAPILLHELVHIRYLHPAVNWFVIAVRAIHFLNPLVWLTWRRLRWERELFCDDKVMSILKDERVAYGDGLLKVLEMSRTRSSLIVLGALGLFESKSHISKRIKRIVTDKRKRIPRLTLFSLAALLALGAFLLSTAPAQVKSAGAESADAIGASNVSCALTGTITEWPKVPSDVMVEEKRSHLRLLIRKAASPAPGNLDVYNPKALNALRVAGGEDITLQNVEYVVDNGVVRYAKIESAYSIEGIAPGDYTVTAVELEGNRIARHQSKALTLADGEKGTLDFDLSEQQTAAQPEKEARTGVLWDPERKAYVKAIDQPGSRESEVAIREAEAEELGVPMTGKVPMTKRFFTRKASESGFAARLPNGVTVELVGVCEHPSAGKKWWRPDGTALGEAPYEKMAFGITQYYASVPGGIGGPGMTPGGGGMVPGMEGAMPGTAGMTPAPAGSRIVREIKFSVPAGAKGYEFAFSVTPLQMAAVRLGEIWGAWPTRYFEANYFAMGMDKDGTAVESVAACFAAIDERLSTTSLRVGVASGPWKKYKEPLSPDAVKGVGHRKGTTEIGFHFDILKDLDMAENHVRLIAVDKYGITHLSNPAKIESRARIMQFEYAYELPVDIITHYQFEISPITWIEFAGVSLEPGRETRVEIRTVPSGTFEPSKEREPSPDYGPFGPPREEDLPSSGGRERSEGIPPGAVSPGVTGPAPATEKTDTSTKEGMKRLVEDFFSRNYKDITRRKTLEWGEVGTDKDGNRFIRYKYEATIWGKDVITVDQVFTFSPEGRFISVEKVGGDAALPRTPSPPDASVKSPVEVGESAPKTVDTTGSESSSRRRTSEEREEKIADLILTDEVIKDFNERNGRAGGNLVCAIVTPPSDIAIRKLLGQKPPDGLLAQKEADAWRLELKRKAIPVIKARIAPDSWQDPNTMIDLRSGHYLVFHTHDVVQHIREFCANETERASKETPQVVLQFHFITTDESLQELVGSSILLRKVGTSGGGEEELLALLEETNLEAILEKVKQDQSSDVMEAPKVTVWDGEQASLEVSTNTVYLADMFPYEINSLAKVKPVVGNLETGLAINVRPQVASDRNRVVLPFAVEISSVASVAKKETPHGEVQLPEIEKTVTESNISISEGKTAIIGGMTISAGAIASRPTDPLEKEDIRRNLYLCITADIVEAAAAEES
jgi:beta-lactamase regulating signal transducer with metallopeptidase domain